jgi:putative transposase
VLQTQYCISESLAKVCKLFGVSRQAYYKKSQHKSRSLLHQEIVLQMVEEIRKIRQWKRLGTEKLHRRLKPQMQMMGIKMGRHSLDRLLKHYGLQVPMRRRKAYTTNSNHCFPLYPNLVAGVELLSPGLVWVADITYLSLLTGFAYLFLITDLYSKKIIGYKLALNLRAENAIEALQMALDQWIQVKGKRLTHHSDRGIQYGCPSYVEVLLGKGIDISMAAKGNPYENPVAERVNGILKNEMGLDEVFTSYEQAKQQTCTTIELYNEQREHKSIDLLTPQKAHECSGKLIRRW